jgi:chorismate synthase
VIAIRHLQTREELDDCVAFQHAIWGPTFNEVVPRTILLIVGKLGGIVAGAFEDDRLIGFVFGLTGLKDGRLVHWSDMLAVDPACRDHGIGRQLKAFQRDAVVARGVTEMYWTYDPLVARNAHFNINRLGAEIVEYVPDMYGTTGSALHGNVPTDRFVVRWGLTESPVQARETRPGDLRVSIPGVADAAATAEWRARTRADFLAAFADGYRVVGFARDGDQAYYTLTRVP